MATNAKITIAEVETIVNPGSSFYNNWIIFYNKIYIII